MQNLWKHINSYLQNVRLSKYLVLGLVLLFSKDVIANAEITILAEKLVEKEKKETEKETSEEEDDEQASSTVGKFKKIKKIKKIAAYQSIYTANHLLAFEILSPVQFYAPSGNVSLPTTPYSAFIHNPRYLQFHSLIFYA